MEIEGSGAVALLGLEGFVLRASGRGSRRAVGTGGDQILVITPGTSRAPATGHGAYRCQASEGGSELSQNAG